MDNQYYYGEQQIKQEQKPKKSFIKRLMLLLIILTISLVVYVGHRIVTGQKLRSYDVREYTNINYDYINENFEIDKVETVKGYIKLNILQSNDHDGYIRIGEYSYLDLNGIDLSKYTGYLADIDDKLAVCGNAEIKYLNKYDRYYVEINMDVDDIFIMDHVSDVFTLEHVDYNITDSIKRRLESN